MGLFSRSAGTRPDQEIGAAERTIKPLHPDFYHSALDAAGKPVTDSNVAAVAGLTSANLALNAHRWLDAIGTPSARAEWQSIFTSDEPDPDIVTRPDRMIDWLWKLSPRLHPGLTEFVASMRETIVRSTQKFGPDLPQNMWES
jgi:hypothetical protein